MSNQDSAVKSEIISSKTLQFSVSPPEGAIVLRKHSDLVKKFLPNFCQWSFMISSTLCFLVARMDSQASTAHRPSFSRM